MLSGDRIPSSRSEQLILIIDDEPGNLRLAVEQLEAYGFEVVIARSGEVGIERALEALPDLILLDVTLPRADGYEVCRRLGTRPETRSIPVIFMTGRTATEDLLRGFDVGGVDYLTKPIAERELLARVRTHLSMKALRSELEERAKELREALEREREVRDSATRRLREAEVRARAQDSQIEALQARLEATLAAAPEKETQRRTEPEEDPFLRLSDRESSIAQMLVEGRANKEIAFSLSLAPTTISTHRTRILEKLAVESLSRLSRLAARYRPDW